MSSVEEKNIKIVYSPWNELLKELISKSKNRITILSPWIKEDAVKILTDAIDKKYKNEILVKVFSRLNSYDLTVGSSDIKAFDNLFKEIPKLKLYIISNLHAKVYVFDSHKILITSGNFTTGGIYRNLELGILVRNKNICTVFEAKLDNITKLLDETTIDNLNYIKEIINNNLKQEAPILKLQENKYPSFGEIIPPSVFRVEDSRPNKSKKYVNAKKEYKAYPDKRNIEDFTENSVINEVIKNEFTEYFETDQIKKELILDIGRNLYRLMLRTKLPKYYFGLDNTYIDPVVIYYSSDKQMGALLKKSSLELRGKNKLNYKTIENEFFFIIGQLIIKNEYKLIENIFKLLRFVPDEKITEKIASSGLSSQLLLEILQNHNKKLKIEYIENKKISIKIYINSILDTNFIGNDKEELQRKATENILEKFGYLDEYKSIILQRQKHIELQKTKDLLNIYKKQVSELRLVQLRKWLNKYEMGLPYLPLLNFAFIHESWIIANNESNIFSSNRYAPFGQHIFKLYCSTILSNYEIFRKLKQEEYFNLVESIKDHVISKFDFSSMILTGKQLQKQSIKKYDKVYHKSFLAFLYVYYLSCGLEKTFNLLNSLCQEEIEKILSDYKLLKNSVQRLEEELKQVPFLPEFSILEMPSSSNHRLYKVGVYINTKKMGIGCGQTYDIAEAKAASGAIERLKYFIQ